MKFKYKCLFSIYFFLLILIVKGSKLKRRYGYKISDISFKKKSSFSYLIHKSKFEDKNENSKSNLSRYFGDRLSAPVQLLESIVTRDIGRFINISGFLSKIGYKFGRSKHSETALTAACKISGEIGYFFVSHLLSLGASVDTYSEYGYTPLLLACKYQHKEVVKLLIEKGKSHIDYADSDGRTPLFYAISQLDINLVNYLLEKGANPNFRDVLGNTPLIHALMVNFKEAVNSLLIHGAFPWIRNYSGFDPVTLSVLENRIHILPILISSKRYSKEEFNIRRNIPEYHHSAARRLLLGIKQYIREQILLELLEIEIALENVVICSTSDQEGLTILWWACKLHYPQLIFRLLEFYLQAQNLPEGHICNPHKTGNNQILPIELLITHLYNAEPPYGFSFRRRFMDLMFKESNKKFSNIPNIDLMNIFSLLFMLDPHSNRSLLIQALYLNRSIESLTKILFGIPIFYTNSNFQSVTQMLILTKNSDIMNRFSKMIRSIIYQLLKKQQISIKDKKLNSNLKSKEDNIKQSVLIITSKIICMVYKRNLDLNIEDFNLVYHRKILNPYIYPLLVIGESNSLEDSNLLSINVIRGNNLLTAFFTNLFNQCIEQKSIRSLFKYKQLCIRAYHGALKLALKQYQPTDITSYLQKAVETSLFILIKNRLESFGEILLELDYCQQSDEAIAIKLIEYIVVGFIPKICYNNQCLFKKKYINHEYKEKNDHFIFENKINSDDYKDIPIVTTSKDEFSNQITKINLSPLEFSTKTLLKFPCEVSTSRFVDLLLFSTYRNVDFLINGWVKSEHISKTLDYILESKIFSTEKPSKFIIFTLNILRFSPKLTKFVLRKSQLNDKTKPFYYYNIKKTMIAESLISHPLFESNPSIDIKIMSIIVISIAISILILIAILIVSDSPSSYRKRYLKINFKQIRSESNNLSDVESQYDKKTEQTITPLDSNSQSESETCISESNTQIIETQEIDLKSLKFSDICNFINKIYMRSIIKVSSFLTSKKQISPTFILANNLPIKSRTIFRAIIFGIKCTFIGYDAYEDIYFRAKFLFESKSSNIYQRKTNSFAFLGITRIIIFLLSIYWIFSCKNYDLFIITIYLSIFSVITNASLSLGSISIQERDKLFHLFIPSSVELPDVSTFKNSKENIDKINFQNESEYNQMIDFINYESSDINPSSNISPILNEKIAYILDKYSDSLLTPVSRLLPTQINQSSFQPFHSINSNNKENVVIKSVIDGTFWDSKLPSHKYWSYKDVFNEYHSLWLSSQYSEVFQTQNASNSNFNSNCNSPNSNTMISQNPFDAINSCMVFSEDYYNSSINKYFNSTSNYVSNNCPQERPSLNSKSSECTPSINRIQNNNINLQNLAIEHHIISTCKAELIKPNDCRIWYIIQWLICIFIIFSFYSISFIDKRNLYYHFLQYPEKWRKFSESTFTTIFFEVIINSHLALLIWCFLNPLGFLWVILIQRFRIFLYIINNLLQRRKKRKLTNINEILILRELTFFITLWNFIISRNNSFLQLTLYNRYFKSSYFCFLFFFMLHFFIIKDQLLLITRSQLFFTLLSFILSLGILLIIIVIFIILTNLITRSISSSINSILHTYYHNKLFHLFLRREIAILSAKKHDAFLHFDY